MKNGINNCLYLQPLWHVSCFYRVNEQQSNCAMTHEFILMSTVDHVMH
jgi:hypothetical protein